MSTGKSWTFYLIGIVIILAAGGGVAVMAYTRKHAESHEADSRRHEVAAGPRAQVAPVTKAKTEQKLDLQGEARPFAEVTLYAKISGYLRNITVDKGDHVEANQLLAIIQSPELDRQYDGAVADADYKRKNASRTATLAKGGFVAPRDAELDLSQAQVAAASVASLVSQKSYEQLRAPFAGAITARYADPGALVQSAVNAQTSAMPVVTISQIDRLRIYAYVDQAAAALVQIGSPAEISLPAGPTDAVNGNSVVNAQVTRMAHELDPRTRMMLVEIDIDNKAGLIVAGSFVRVGLTLKATPAVEIPVEALILRDRKPFVATLHSASDPRINFRPIVLAPSGGLSGDGAHIRVASGLDAGELVALNLGENVPEGAIIQPVFRPTPPQQQAGPQNGAGPQQNGQQTGQQTGSTPPQNGQPNSSAPPQNSQPTGTAQR